jgi:hypothetical protein
MAPSKRTVPSTDHDLLVRIDEQLIHLTATVNAGAAKTESRLDELAREKADKAEIQEIKRMLEEKLPKDSFESVVAPLYEKQRDQEGRIRKMEKIGWFAIGGGFVVQMLFNAWIVWVVK